MTPETLNRRRRLLRARAVAERLAQQARTRHADATSGADRLALRLDDEAQRCVARVGPTTGASFAAQAALADRIRGAQHMVAQRCQSLAADLARADAAMQAAHRDKRSAERLVERGEHALAAVQERRLAVPHRRQARPA